MSQYAPCFMPPPGCFCPGGHRVGRDAALRLPAWSLLKKDQPETPDAEQAAKEERAPSGEQGPWLICGACRLRVVHSASRISVHGSHEHRCVNPEGIAFHLGCFSNAPGCTAAGTPTAFFSWFPGYSWSVVVCRQCGLHLGWEYAGAGDRFYGLLLNRLEEEGN